MSGEEMVILDVIVEKYRPRTYHCFCLSCKNSNYDIFLSVSGVITAQKLQNCYLLSFLSAAPTSGDPLSDFCNDLETAPDEVIFFYNLQEMHSFRSGTYIFHSGYC